MKARAFNFWTYLGFSLIVLGLLFVFLSVTGQWYVVNGNSGLAGYGVFGDIVSLILSLPIYMIIAGLICIAIGFLKEILRRLMLINVTQGKIAGIEINDGEKEDS